MSTAEGDRRNYKEMSIEELNYCLFKSSHDKNSPGENVFANTLYRQSETDSPKSRSILKKRNEATLDTETKDKLSKSEIKLTDAQLEANRLRRELEFQTEKYQKEKAFLEDKFVAALERAGRIENELRVEIRNSEQRNMDLIDDNKELILENNILRNTLAISHEESSLKRKKEENDRERLINELNKKNEQEHDWIAKIERLNAFLKEKDSLIESERKEKEELRKENKRLREDCKKRINSLLEEFENQQFNYVNQAAALSKEKEKLQGKLKNSKNDSMMKLRLMTGIIREMRNKEGGEVYKKRTTKSVKKCLNKSCSALSLSMLAARKEPRKRVGESRLTEVIDMIMTLERQLRDLKAEKKAVITKKNAARTTDEFNKQSEHLEIIDRNVEENEAMLVKLKEEQEEIMLQCSSLF